MGTLGWLLFLMIAVAICFWVLRRISTQRQMAGIGQEDASGSGYSSRSYYSSSSLTRLTSNMLSDMQIDGARSRGTLNGNGSDGGHEQGYAANGSEVRSQDETPDATCDSSDTSKDEESSSTYNSKPSDSEPNDSERSDSGSSYESSSDSSDSSSSSDSGSSSDSSSSDS
jgi:hypothetical protein